MAEDDALDSAIRDSRRLAIELKKLGDKEIISELRRTITAKTKPLRTRIRAQIRQELPGSGRKGSLSMWVGKNLPNVEAKFLPNRASIRVKLAKREHDLVQMNDSGYVRHPLFGSRKRWFVTRLDRADWWGFAVAPEADEIIRISIDAIDAAIDRAIEKYGR